MFIDKIVNTPNEIKVGIEYLKKSDFPLVLFGAAAFANHVFKLLHQNKITINHVVVDDNYSLSNQFFHDYPN